MEEITPVIKVKLWTIDQHDSAGEREKSKKA